MKIFFLTIVATLTLFGGSLSEKRLDKSIAYIKNVYNIDMINKMCLKDFCSAESKQKESGTGTVVNFRHRIIDILPNPYSTDKLEYNLITVAILMSLADVSRDTAEKTILQLANKTVEIRKGGEYFFSDVQINVKVRDRKITYQFMK